jgi:hypothetical protein
MGVRGWCAPRRWASAGATSWTARGRSAPATRGCSGGHVVPNAIGAALVATSLGVGNAILLESGLSFLGLGHPAAGAELGAT